MTHAPRFVIHEHRASRLRFDARLAEAIPPCEAS